MKKLSIPEKIVLEKQYFPGIGKHELRQLMVTALPGLLLSFVLFFTLEAPGARLGVLLAGFLFCGACYSLFVKVEGGFSIYTFLKRVWQFHRSQKSYYYMHGKEEVHYVGEERRP